MHALLVDDSRAIRTIVGRIVRELGFELVEATNGQHALEQLAANPQIGIALVDWNMPEMDGFQFVQAVRAESRWDHMKIMMITTESEAPQVARAMAAGANQYVTKPFTKETLLAKLGLLGIAPSKAA